MNNQIDFVLRYLSEDLDESYMAVELDKVKYALLAEKSAYIVTKDNLWIWGYKMERVGAGTDKFSGKQKWAFDFSPFGMPKDEIEKFIGKFEPVTLETAIDYIWPRKAISTM